MKQSQKNIIGKTNVKLLQSMQDSEIDTSDIAELKKTELEKGVKINFSNPQIHKIFMKNPQQFLKSNQNKKAISIRLDDEIITFFKIKTKGKGYQTVINNILKEYVQANKYKQSI